MIDEAEGATGGGLLFHFRRPNGRNMSRIDHIEEKPRRIEIACMRPKGAIK